MRKTIWVGAALLFLFPSIRAEEAEAKEQDPWVGKTRAEVVKTLGEPTKAKRPRRGGETLTYTFYRIDPELPAPLDMQLIPVPGIGIVGRHVAAGLPDGSEIAIGPTGVDKHGRPTGTGGISTTERASATYDPETGELERSGSRENAVQGKVKLILELDETAHVREWSVSGKK